VSERGRTQSAKHKDLTTWHPVREDRTAQCTQGGYERVQEIVPELLGHRFDAEFLVDDRVEVCETVARVLARDAHHDDLGGSPAGVTRLDEAAVYGGQSSLGSV
jgi:hypothetical protein